jgi:hypothetical protein
MYTSWKSAKQLIFLCFFSVTLTGCFHQEHSLHPDALKAIPYKGGEKLVFMSISGKIDTIFIQSTTSAMIKGGDPFSINPDKFEHKRVAYTTGRIKEPQGLLYLSSWGTTYQMNFEFDAGHSRLFGYQILTKPEYDKLPNTTLETTYQIFKDVKVLSSEEYYDDRQKRIMSFYWSTSAGLLGWDTPSARWRLKEIK